MHWHFNAGVSNIAWRVRRIQPIIEEIQPRYFPPGLDQSLSRLPPEYVPVAGTDAAS